MTTAENTAPQTADAENTADDQTDRPQLGKPRTEYNAEGRRIEMSWPVGDPKESGEQKRATLTVSYDKGHGYRAILATMHETRGEFFVGQRLNLSLMRTDVTIHEVAAARFNKNKLVEHARDAYAKLRNRYENGDEAVTTYFDPESPVFDYA